MRINKRILAFVPITVFLIFTVLQGCGSSWQSKVKEQLPVLNSSYFIFYYPIQYDYELIVEKGLGNSKKKLSDDYKLMQALYKKAFITYIADKLDIKKYDEELANSELNFISDESDSYMGAKYYLGTKYFMILNPCYIERLDKSDLELLRRTIETGNAEVTEELDGMVQRTWPEITRINGKYEDFYVMTNKSPKYKFPNNAIVLGIGKETYKDENGNVDMSKEVIKDDFLRITAPK
jgi:hypothetical protein